MLQDLLVNRFAFKGHIEMREGPVYLLMTAKTSPKLQEAEASVSGGGENKRPENFAGITSGGRLSAIELKGHQASMQQLADLMSFYLRTQVLDHTGLLKKYNFVIHFDGRLPDLRSETPEGWPPAEVAFPEQLGLKLVRARGPVKTVVIDAIQEPSPN